MNESKVASSKEALGENEAERRVGYHSFVDKEAFCEIRVGWVATNLKHLAGRRVKPSTFRHAQNVGDCVKFVFAPKGYVSTVYPHGYVVESDDKTLWVYMDGHFLRIQAERPVGFLKFDWSRAGLHDFTSGAYAEAFASVAKASADDILANNLSEVKTMKLERDTDG